MTRGRWLLAMLTLAVLAAIAVYPRAATFLARDSCLDGGGAWRDGECVGRRPTG